MTILKFIQQTPTILSVDESDEDAFLGRYANVIQEAFENYFRSILDTDARKFAATADAVEAHLQAATLSGLDAIQAEIDRHQQSADLLAETITVLSVKLEVQRRIISNLKGKPAKIARSGGQGKAVKFKTLEAETLRLFNEGEWKNASAAALEITPKIVALSRNGNGDLSPTTLKRLQWIRNELRRTRVRK